MTLREFIRERIIFMANRPLFIASSRESFVQQLLLLMEMYGGVDLMEAQIVVYHRRAMYHSEVCPIWAKEIVDSALILLDKAPVTNMPGWRIRK